MSFELPPDPYAALGLTTKADLQAIRSAYRKLVLKCHPDKFTDVNTKAQKQEEFHKIQQAYEAIGEEEAKSRYDASVRLAELRKEAVERQRRSGESTRAEPRATSYNVRTAAPSFHTAAASAEPRSRSYEEIHRDYDEQRSSSRKYDGYESHSRRSPRTDREERTRTEKKKTKDRDERRERSTKYSYVEDDDSDERARYERLRRREEEDREVRRKAEEARRRAEEQRKENEEKPRKAKRAEYAEPVYEQRVNDAKSYIEKSRGGSLDAGRPTPTRSGSSSHYEIRHERPVEVRRSRVSRERRSSRERERKSPYAEIVEPADARRPPPLVQSRSSPANIKVARRSPERSYSEYPPAAPPAPRLNRSDSEPVRSKDVRPAQPSRLRESTTVPHDSGYSSPTTPDQYSPTSKPTPATASTTTTKQYRYAPASGGVSLAAADDDYANPRTVLREPDRYHARSPSPTARPSKHERVVHSSSRTVPVPAPTSPYVSTSQRPPVPHATSYRMEDARVDDRGRERSRRALYGEVTDARRGTKTSGGSYTMDDVKFSKRYGKDDVSYSTSNDPLFKAGYEAARREMMAGYGQRDRYDDPPRPRMERSATYAC